MSNLQTNVDLKLNFLNAEQHTKGKWLIHGTDTKHYKDNQLQSLELSLENFFNPIFSNEVQGQKHPRR